MKLKIEDWLNEQHFSPKITPIFEESIKAYKASAYKAGLLFSYLGFLSVLKSRINQAQNPAGINPGKWEMIRNQLNNDEQWDTFVFQAIIRRKERIFVIPESVIQEVAYWKDRRNDCAHFKHENIDYHHVESFWSFLQTHLPKFVVNGSKESLLQKMKEHFDYSFTPKGKDITPLVKEISNAVNNPELQLFFESIEKELSEDVVFYNDNGKSNLLFNSILSNCSAVVQEELIAFLKGSIERLVSFLHSHPDKTLQVHLTQKEARKICIDHLFEPPFFFESGRRILASIMLNDLIEEDQREDIYNSFLASTDRSFYEDTNLMDVLVSRGFLDFAHKRILELHLSDFDRGNNHRFFVVWYLSTAEITKEVVEKIFSPFNSANHPWHLRDELRRFFQGNLGVKKQFMSLAPANEIKVPKVLF